VTWFAAGLVVRGEKPFRGRDADYRVIPSSTRPDQLLLSHISINLDRTGFQEDWNVVFPLDRLNELAAEGAIGLTALHARRERARALSRGGGYRYGRHQLGSAAD
jgi:hypothetical protein